MEKKKKRQEARGGEGGVRGRGEVEVVTEESTDQEGAAARGRRTLGEDDA